MDRSLPDVSSPIPMGSIPGVSIVIPARNEEASLGACLESLTAQAGVTFEIVVVDDGSSDRTPEIARSFAGVRLIPLSSDPPHERWTGKNNALVAGAKQARAEWLLFTDADTVHSPGSLARALHEAKKERADLLSYSPAQALVSFSERAVMPVVFAELAAQYPPHKVRDEKSDVVAANGQYILVRRAPYDAVGGHAAVATEILEDVALARLFCNAARRVHFRYGGDAVRTRMYRSWPQLREGWTKNLALLFPQPGFLAFQSLLLWFTAWATLAIAVSGALSHRFFMIAFAACWLLVVRRVRAAHFTTANSLIAIAAGLPLFAYLLLRSKHVHANGQVEWKGRAYDVSVGRMTAPDAAVKRAPGMEGQGLKTGN